MARPDPQKLCIDMISKKQLSLLRVLHYQSHNVYPITMTGIERIQRNTDIVNKIRSFIFLFLLIINNG